MFEFVRQHNRVLQFVLILLIFPSFVVFGIQGYNKFNEGHATVAEVAGSAITQAELDSVYRNQIERMRAQMPNVDLKLLDTPQMKARVLDDLVRERVLLEAVRKLNLSPSDERLQRIFQTDPQFAAVRNEDGTVRKEWLAAQGLSSEQFVARLRQELAAKQVTNGLAESSLATAGVASIALDAFFQRREVQVARFEPKAFLPRVSAEPADLKAFYDDPAQAQAFMKPEQAKVEYVVLDLDTVQRSVTVPAEEIKAYYDQNITRYTQAKERRARHILIKAEKDATADGKAKARAQAEALLAELQKNRGLFAELARKHSGDPGSATRGGDLDWFGMGDMTKAFEDAAFALKKGDLSAVVESEFGFHLIEVTDQRGGEARSFETVKAEIEQELKRQLAQKRFAEVAEQFTSAVEAEETLKPVADKMKLALQSAEGVTPQAAPGATGVLAQPKLLEALFAADSVRTKRNTAAIDIGANQLVAARVIAYSPAHRLPLDDVKDQLRERVLNHKAALEASREGQAKLKQWLGGDLHDESSTLAATELVSRAAPQGKPALSRDLVDAALRVPAHTLPAWTGVALASGGYAVIKVLKVLPADAALVGAPAQAQSQYARLWGQAETDAYQSALRTRFKAEIQKVTAPPPSDNR